MTIIRCFHGGAEIRNDDHNKEEGSGVCDICLKMHRDIKWYKKNNMKKVAKKIELIFWSRKIIPELEIQKKNKIAQDYLDYWHARLFRVV